nr:CHAT domain-containing protein [Eubacterium sp. MSJ-13]
MVVLSACNSGNSLLYSSNHLAGLHIAFAAAGVNYIVSSLWEVDDFATAVLMQLFSEEWNNGKSVEKSLLDAKEKMRNMTAGEIYYYIARNDAIDSIPNEVLDDILSMDSERRIFDAPYYWAGFVCYQNMFKQEVENK